jgi:hypothetical protein
MPYQWKNNLACVATYKILEGDKFLDQFEDIDISFDDAADVKLGTLRYFPQTTSNENILEILSIEMGRKFLTHLVKTYTVEKQEASDNPGKIVKKFATIFRSPEKTIRDLAEAVDGRIKFPDEAVGGA